MNYLAMLFTNDHYLLLFAVWAVITALFGGLFTFIHNRREERRNNWTQRLTNLKGR